MKANETKLNNAHAGVGSVSFTTCLLLNSIIGVKPTTIPFNGTGPSMNALVGGQVDYMCDQIVNAVPQVKAGTSRPMRSRRRSAIRAAGRADHQGGRPAGIRGLGLERAVRPEGHAESRSLDKLTDALDKALDDEGVRKRLLDLGSDIPGSAPRPRSALRAGEERSRQVGQGDQGSGRRGELSGAAGLRDANGPPVRRAVLFAVVNPP